MMHINAALEKIIKSIQVETLNGNTSNSLKVGYIKEIKELFKPEKVKLPKEAYEWMENKTSSFESKLVFLINDYANNRIKNSGMDVYLGGVGNIEKLFKANEYGYELEETEEDRIKRSLRETIYKGLGAMATDELVNDLYDIVNPKFKWYYNYKEMLTC